MTVRDQELIQIGQFVGSNNIARETSLPIIDDRAVENLTATLRDTANIDLDSRGKIRTRPGFTLSGAGSYHSLWRDDRFAFALAVKDGALIAIDDGMAETELVTGLPDVPVSYASLPSHIAWTNGTQSGVVSVDLDVGPWATPNPSGVPSLSLTLGSLDLGVYQVTMTYIDVTGRESGAAQASEIEVTSEGQGILLSDIPQTADPSVARVRIYATSPGDAVSRRIADIPMGMTTYIMSQYVGGKTLNTQFLEPMPAGQIVRAFAARSIVADGRWLLFSEAMRYGLYNPATNRVGFPDVIDMVEPVADGSTGAGLFVASGGKTYFLTGADPGEWAQKIAYPYGCVPGTSIQSTASVWGIDSAEMIPAWLSRNGLFVIGLPGGSVKPLKQGEFVVDSAEYGGSFFREADGLRQMIAALRAPQRQSMQFSDRAEATVVRHDAA